MTIFFASNTGAAFINPEGEVVNQTTGFDASFVASSIGVNTGTLEYALPSIQTELWIHFDGDISLNQNNAHTIGGFNISANRYDWYWYRTPGNGTNFMRLFMWNGSSFVAIGNQISGSEPVNYDTYDVHYIAHASNGVIEVYKNGEISLSATGLNTSGFSVGAVHFNAALSSLVRWSQVIIADECTICWKLAATPLINASEGIQFVGSNLQALAGAVSGTTNIALNSGLTGGVGSAVAVDDYVVAIFAAGSTTNITLSITDGTNPYTLLGTELYANDTFDTNLRVAFKKMGATPDTFVQFGNTGAVANAGVIGVYVVRGVDTTTFLDVAVTTATGTNGGNVDLPTITPITTLSAFLFVGATAHDGTRTSHTNVPGFVNFVQQNGTGTNAVLVFVGMVAEWLSAALNPAALTGTSTNTFSWGGMSIVLRPMQVAQTFTDSGATATVVAGNSSKSVASYISSAAADQKYRSRSRRHALVSAGYLVKAVGTNTRVRRGDTGPQSVNALIRSARTDYNKSDVAVSPAIDSINAIWETDPATSAPWTIENANLALVGVRSRT